MSYVTQGRYGLELHAFSLVTSKGQRCPRKTTSFLYTRSFSKHWCAAGFALLNLSKGKSLGRSKPATNSSNEQAH
jgi:hypothetical protein